MPTEVNEPKGAIRLPDADQLLELLGPTAEPGGVVVGPLEKALLMPLSDFTGRAGKRLRAQLVEWGAVAAQGEIRNPEALRRAEQIVESIHAGSMIIDDIEDETLLRRGEPTLHRRFGVATALNAGNWLYFYPLESIRRWGLSPEQELLVYRLVHSALLRAHFGQAVDIGTPMDEVPRESVASLCLRSLELKSGALTELAVLLGAFFADLAVGQDARSEAIGNFGRKFGVALQMFDDIGNLNPPAGMESKRYEDLRLRRPSWVWATVARHAASTEYRRFVEAIQALPDEGLLQASLEANQIQQIATAEAVVFLEATVEEAGRALAMGPCDPARVKMDALAGTLRSAYAR